MLSIRKGHFKNGSDRDVLSEALCRPVSLDPFSGRFLTWISAFAEMTLLAVVVACVTELAVAATVFASDADWKSIEREAVALLSRYIQIDTTNPPGNEIKAAEFFKEIFDREGIESNIIESAPQRGNILARLKGNGSKPAIVLLNHMDVVPADAKLWKEPPFGGDVKDGTLWGRGSLDMKGPAIVQLMAFLTLKRLNAPLKSDIIFVGTADEEAGGALGAGFLVEKHPELFQGVGLVLTEGGGIRLGEDGRARFYSVGVAEKTPLWLKLTAKGAPGHGSTPGNDAAVNKLVAALNRILDYQAPIKVVPAVQKFYAETARFEAADRRKQYEDLRLALKDPVFAAEFTKEPRNNASVRNTIAITGIRGSDKVNVIPAVASAEIDVRLLPGEDPKAFVDQIRNVIRDDSIAVDVTLSFPPATSREHVEALRVIRQMANVQDGGAPVISPLGRGFTDCHFFREKGIPCYGFIPLRTSAGGEGLVHGVNERISLESLFSALRSMYGMVAALGLE
ncbi:MAG TPA: M20/M25/M40 family metallo-hydrolase [Candidatus Binatia bacterium]